VHLLVYFLLNYENARRNTHEKEDHLFGKCGTYCEGKGVYKTLCHFEHVIVESEDKQEWQCTHNLTLKSVGVIVVGVEK
jgi:hypothetical protein